MLLSIVIETEMMVVLCLSNLCTTAPAMNNHQGFRRLFSIKALDVLIFSKEKLVRNFVLTQLTGI